MTATDSREVFGLGLRALAHERIDLAIDLLNQASLAAPTDPAPHAFLASALFAAARPAESAEAIARSLALGPDDFWPNQKAGELRLRLGDPAAAAEHFLAAMRAVDPGTPDASAAQQGLARARREVAGGIQHRAILPRVSWLSARRRPGAARSARDP